MQESSFLIEFYDVFNSQKDYLRVVSPKTKNKGLSLDRMLNKKPVLFTGIIVLCLGLVVICGWIINSPALIQINPKFVPMQFNTALCFFLSSLATLFFSFNKKTASLTASILAFLLSSLTLLQYIVKSNFGIDELFFDHYITVKSFYPGRMAPNTALCFMLYSVHFWLHCFRNLRQKYLCIPVTLVFALSAVAFFGYVSDLQTSPVWGNLTEMAIHTSSGFIILSVGFLVYYWENKDHEDPVPEWTVSVTFIFGVTSTLIFWQALLAQSQDNIRIELESFSQLVQKRIQSAVDSRYRAGQAIFKNNPLVDKELETELKSYLENFITFKKAEAFDIDSTKNFIQIPDKNKSGAGIYREVANENKYWLCFFIGDQQEKSYFLAAELDVFINEILKGLNMGSLFRISLRQDGKEIFPYEGNGFLKDFETKNIFKVGDSELEIRLSPTEALMDQKKSKVYTLFLIVGIAASGLFSTILHFWRKLYYSKEALREAMNGLETLVEDLTRKNTDLERFAYIASHDLQEPLRMVIQFNQLLKKEYGDKFDGDALQYLNFSTEASLRMKHLIEDLLRYSRMSNAEEQMETTDLNEILLTVKQNLSKMIEDNKAEISSDKLPTLTFNKVQAIQLLQNLISNSIKYRKPKEAPEIILKTIENNDHWIIKVSDNGIGIPENKADDIFLPFKRLKHSKKYPGSGIGLSVCKKIVENHEGFISVESELGKGTTFSLKLMKNQR